MTDGMRQEALLCIEGALANYFETGCDDDGYFYVKSTHRTTGEMEDLVRMVTHHMGLHYAIVAIKAHPEQGNVLKLIIQ